MHNALARFGRTHEARLLIVNVVIIVFLSVFATGFFSLENVFNLMTSYAFVGILAAGLVVVLVAGSIDISMTATATIAQYLAVTAVSNYDVGWAVLFGVALGTGLLLGLLNAVLVTWLRISSIIVTIALLNVYYGLLMFFSKGDPINFLPDWYADGMSWVIAGEDTNNPLILNMQIIGLVVAFIVAWFLLNRLSVGRQLGGASLAGGSGTILGTVLGLLLLALLQNGLILLGVSSFWIQFATGFVFLGAVSTIAWDRKRQQRALRRPIGATA
jgi:ribose/xylose/arabinose/galactoside ABC-type transport system permease subunit